MEKEGGRRRDKRPKQTKYANHNPFVPKRPEASPAETTGTGHRPADADIHEGPVSPELPRSLLGRSDLNPLASSSSSQEATFFGADTTAIIEGGQCINHRGDVNTIHNHNYNFTNPKNPVVEGQNSPPGRGPRNNRRGSSQARRGKNATTRQQAAITTLSHQRSNKIYESHLKRKDRGYPLWMPQPGMGFPVPYRIKGVSIGDVGITNPYGGFDFLFNICLPHDNPINPPLLPDGFVPIHPALGLIDVGKVREFAPGSFLTASSVTMRYCDKKSPTAGLSFECSDPEGAILTIPDGAYHEELVNISRFKHYMAKHLENWYKFVNGPLGREAKNGDIRLVVGCDKTTRWGMAVFSNPPQTTSQLTFRLDEQHQMGSVSKHVWEHSAIVGEVRVGPGDDENDELEATPERLLRNQCLFVRTLNVLLADHIWVELEATLLAARGETSDSDYTTGSAYTSQSRDSGGGNSSSTSFNDTQNSQHGNQPADQLPAVGEDDSPLDSTHHSFVVTEFTPSPPIIHPSKILNKLLLLQKPNAIMAITRDRDWYSLLSEQDAVFPDPSMVLQRIQKLNDICEDSGIVYLQPKRRDQAMIDEEKAQIAKLRLELVSGRTSLLLYLLGQLHGEMQLQLLKTIEDLDNHISSAPHPLECRVPLSLPGNPDRLLVLDDLLRLLREEFVYEDVQEESIPSLWNRLNSLVVEDESHIRIQCFLRLGNVLQRSYSRLNLADDLEDAIHCYSQAASLSSPSRSHYQHLDASLGLVYSIHQRYIAKGNLDDLIILKSTLEQQRGFDIKTMLQPLEDQLLPPSLPPHTRLVKQSLKSPSQPSSLGGIVDMDWDPPPPPPSTPLPMTGFDSSYEYSLLPPSGLYIINPVLGVGGILAYNYDLSDPPSSMTARFPTPPTMWDEPATSPGMHDVTIVSSSLPWKITITAAKPGGPITVQDVINGMYRALRTNVTEAEFSRLLSHEARHRVAAAYKRRYKRMPDFESSSLEEVGGVKRVDFLMERTEFMGLAGPGESGQWNLVVPSDQ